MQTCKWRRRAKPTQGFQPLGLESAPVFHPWGHRFSVLGGVLGAVYTHWHVPPSQRGHELRLGIAYGYRGTRGART